MPTRVMLAIVCLLMDWSASAGINTWSKLGPEGGAIGQIVYHRGNPSIVYASTAAGFHRSIDGGATWQPHLIDYVYSDPSGLVVDPSNSDRIYAAESSRLYTSSDAGKTFTTLTAPAAGVSALTVGADGVVYVTGDSGVVFRSTTQGKTWEQRGNLTGTSGFLPKIFSDPVNPLAIYARTTDGLYASPDGGLTWTFRAQTSANGLHQVTQFVIDPLTPSRIWGVSQPKLLLSSDYGATWSAVFPAPPSNLLKDAPVALALNPANPNVAHLAVHDGRIFSSTDQGLHWNLVASRGEPITTFAINPVNTNELLAGSRSGLASMVLPATSWTRRNSGLIATMANRVLTLKKYNRNYFLSNEGVLFTENGTLAAANNTMLQADLIFPYFYKLFGTTDSLFVLGPGSVKSTDGGVTWTSMPSISPAEIHSLVVSPHSEQVLYAGSTLGIKKSMDGGGSWTDSGSGMPANDPFPASSQKATIKALATGNDGSTVYAGTLGAGIYKTISAGQQWTAANSGIADRFVYGIAVDPTDDRTVYAATSNAFNAGPIRAISKSTDGGGAWSDTLTSTDLFIDVKIDPSNPRIVYAIGYNNVWRSINAGQTWQRVAQPISGEKPCCLSSLSIDPQQSSTLYLGTSTNGLKVTTLASNLSLALTAPASLMTGVQATYTLTAQNKGPWDVTDVRVTATLPTAVATSTSVTGATCATAVNLITCTIPEMRNNASVPISVSVTPNATGSLHISATIESALTELDGSDNSVVDNKEVGAAVPSASGTGNSGGGGGGGHTDPAWLLLLVSIWTTRVIAFHKARGIRQVVTR